MMKKVISAVLVTVMLVSMLCIGVNAAYGKAGNFYYTDIKSYVRGQLINSYNIGGKTVIGAEDLRSYGFNVVWDGANRTLRITDNKGSAVSNATAAASGPIGAVAGSYYHTDIVTYFNNTAVESYNLGGVTVIVATELRKFGYDVTWDGTNRKVLIDMSSSGISNVTIAPNQSYHGTMTMVTQAPSFNGLKMVTSHDCYIETALDKKIYIPFEAFANCLGITYTWNSATSTLNVSVPADKVIAPKESKAKSNGKTYGTMQYETKDIVLNIVNGSETHSNLDAIIYGTEVFVEAQDLAEALNFFCVNQTDFFTETMMYLVYSGQTGIN